MLCLNDKKTPDIIKIGSCLVPVRTDEYAPALTVTENGTERDLTLCRKGDAYETEYKGAKIRVKLADCDEGIDAVVSVTAGKDCFKPEKFSIRTGVDCYMKSYPEWNAQFYPTFMRCEKTHFWGYFRRTDGVMLAVAGDAVSSWRNSYNRVYYDPKNFDDPGHRIYTATIDLLNALPQPDRHPLTCP